MGLNPNVLKNAMKRYSRWARAYPALSDHILLNVDGLASTDDEYYSVWKDAILDITGDTSDQGKLRTIIRKMVLGLQRPNSLEGARAVDCLAGLARLMPAIAGGGKHGLLFTCLETCFPFWKSPAMEAQFSAYVDNLLSLAKALGYPATESIFELIISRAVEMDIALHSGLENAISAANVPAAAPSTFTLRPSEAFSTGSFDEFYQPDSLQQPFPCDSLEQSSFCRKKLYNLLETFLIFFEANESQMHEFGLSLIRIFDRTVLPALYCSRVTVLLAFAACKDAAVADKLLGYLLAVLFNRDPHVGASLKGRLPSANQGPATLMAISSYIRSFCVHLTCVSDTLLQSSVELLLIFCARKTELMSAGRQISSPVQSATAVRKTSWLNESATDRSIVVSAFCAFLHLTMAHSETLRPLIVDQSTQMTLQQLVQSPLLLIESCPKELWTQFVDTFSYNIDSPSTVLSLESNQQHNLRPSSPLLSLYLSEGFESADPFMPIPELANLIPSAFYRLPECNK